MLWIFQWRWLGASLYDSRRECAEIVQLFGDDGMDDIEIEAGVFVHGHIAEADHSLHVLSEFSWKNSGGL